MTPSVQSAPRLVARQKTTVAAPATDPQVQEVQDSIKTTKAKPVVVGKLAVDMAMKQMSELTEKIQDGRNT